MQPVSLHLTPHQLLLYVNCDLMVEEDDCSKFVRV